MNKEYIEKRNDGYWIKEKRISLDSIVYSFQNGKSPESIGRSFPLLTLEEIYGAIAFYLANQKEIDEYLIQEEIRFEKLREDSRKKNTDWYKRMEKARRELLAAQV